MRLVDGRVVGEDPLERANVDANVAEFENLDGTAERRRGLQDACEAGIRDFIID